VTDEGAASYAGSIIVPAFNEVGRIGPLLPVLHAAARELGCLVIVACNGCTDGTVELVRRTEGLTVLELAEPSKPHALNEAERVAGDTFPRLYVDADVRTDTASLSRLLDALAVDEPRAVRPFEDYEWDGGPWLPRVFYESRYTVPSSRSWLEDHVEGHHIYGTNAAGRAKFERFPEEGQIMEDAFFDRMFDQDEKLAVVGAHVVVPLPPTSRALLRGLTRVYQGNWELDAWLREHRPDRVGTGASSATDERGVRGRLRSIAPGGPTFASWRPRTVLVALTSLVVRAIAKRNARRLVTAGEQAAWR
jgi:hypothetical protein